MKTVTISLLILLFPLSLCAENCKLISLGSNTVGTVEEVKGFYSSSFEHSGFTPCEESESQWWVHAPYHADLLNQEMTKLGGSKYEPPKQRLFVKAKVCMSKEGRYGHMGGYSRYIKIMQVITRHPEGENDCTEEAADSKEATSLPAE